MVVGLSVLWSLGGACIKHLASGLVFDKHRIRAPNRSPFHLFLIHFSCSFCGIHDTPQDLNIFIFDLQIVRVIPTTVRVIPTTVRVMPLRSRQSSVSASQEITIYFSIFANLTLHTLLLCDCL